MVSMNMVVSRIFFFTSNSKLFREYIGAESDTVKLSDVPINPTIEFHFILAFAIDYTKSNNSLPTNGNFNIFWETQHLGPTDIASIKHNHSNVKIAVSLGGDTVSDNKNATFAPKSINSWLHNAISSLTSIIKIYHIDGIDIDYEHFDTDPETFAECIGRLIVDLKRSGTIKFASIAPYDDDDDGPVQTHYVALWRKYGHVIDYVNFQFYGYEKLESVSQFLWYFEKQALKYQGGRILGSFISGGELGLGPDEGFFEACDILLRNRKLGGIFVWCADESLEFGFKYEKMSQDFLELSS
ncbi:hypothetical protein UlMin_013562 [Ulmus minor]